MAEPTTRDEHVAAIREVLEDAEAIGNLDADEYLQKATVEALIYIGDQLGKLFDRLGPPPAEAKAPLWVPTSKHRYERDGGVWALEYRSRLVDDDPDAGWWLYGPTSTTGSRMGHGGLALAQQRADYRIDEMVGHAGPHPQLDWRVKTSARDLFSCVIDGDLWWLARAGGAPEKDPQPCHWRLSSGNGQRTIRLDGAAEESETAAQLAAEKVLKTWYPSLAEPEDEVPF